MLKELQANTHEVQEINNRSTRHPPINEQYSNVVLKIIFLISAQISHHSQISRDSSLHTVHIMQCGVVATLPYSSDVQTPLQIVNRSTTFIGQYSSKTIKHIYMTNGHN